MKKYTYMMFLFVPAFLQAQSGATSFDKVDLIDAVKIEEPAIDGVSVDTTQAKIPEVTTALPGETEIVLELPGQSGTGVTSSSETIAVEETISVDFPDEDVRTILRNVADLFDLNLVIPDTLQGRTSLKLSNITWRQVFEIVLEQQGFTYVVDRNIIRIKSIEELTTEPVDTRVFVVNYAGAEALESSIRPLIDTAAGGRIQVDARSNALVITERPSRMNKIQEIIDRLDSPTDQVMIESKFVEVANTDTKNLGINWASLSGYSVSGGPFQRSVEDTNTRDRTSSRSAENTDVGFLQGQQELANDVVGGLAGGRLTPAPSNLDAINQAISLNSNGDPLDDVVVPDAVFEDIGGASLLSNTVGDLRETIDTALFSADQFELILSALKTNNDVELVSNPTVVTLNNTPAKIAIGERFPIPTFTFNAETGQRQLDEIEYLDIGINLDVTPQVNSAGFINLNIIPEVSSQNGFSIIENTEIPIIESRRTETSITIKDGYTLAIGGLTDSNTVQGSTKVPVLGDLPGIGRLFRSTSDSLESRSLIIFITAKTLNPDGSTYKDIIDPRIIHQMGILPSEVPGYEIPKEELKVMDDLEKIRESSFNSDQIDELGATLEALKEAEAAKAKAKELELQAKERAEQGEDTSRRSEKRK